MLDPDFREFIESLNDNNVRNLGFKPLDALHLACAEDLNCDCFLTVDKGILKKAAAVVAVRIMNPLDFVVEQGL
jgi:predicted nucleic acid-binding protein